MIVGGIASAFFGRKINAKISSAAVGKLFVAHMVVIIVINVFK